MELDILAERPVAVALAKKQVLRPAMELDILAERPVKAALAKKQENCRISTTVSIPEKEGFEPSRRVNDLHP